MHACTCRRRSWLAQLNIEDSGVGFANFAWSSASSPPAAAAAGAQVAPHYRFLPPSSPESFLHLKLEGMGPKLLVSDVSTADQPILRWRLVVRGNTAVEFGVVPLCLEVRSAYKGGRDCRWLAEQLRVCCQCYRSCCATTSMLTTNCRCVVCVLMMVLPQEDDKALHKCQQEQHKFEHLHGKLQDEQRPTGFCSSITVGSLLPFKTGMCAA